MLYFAYGSNMCTGRLVRRVPSAVADRKANLPKHSFRFHKRSTDGSGKGNALDTGNPQDVVWGVIFMINEREKPAMDDAEGLGAGYVEKTATVIDDAGAEHRVVLYVADPRYIDAALQPYSWYKRFVVEGARQHTLPKEHVDALVAIPDREDPDQARDRRNRSIAC
jgi:hypothetical protein